VLGNTEILVVSPAVPKSNYYNTKTLRITAVPVNHPAVPKSNYYNTKTLRITAVPVNHPAVPNSKFYHSQSSMDYWSSCQSLCRTKFKTLSYTNYYELLQFLSNPMPYPSKNIIIHKSLWVTACSVNPTALTKSQYNHKQGSVNFWSACQFLCRTLFTIL